MKYSVSMKKNHEFRRLYAKGKSVATPPLVVYFRRTNKDYNQLGLTVSTKVGNAVTRNLVRRRLREIYRLNEERIQKGIDMVVVARQKSPYISYAELEKAYLYACSQLGILSDLPKSGDNV
ncbi:MAG: ribonuclease P protein component [Oscillospiraceae bacterium]|nr:ribonuclease P protein component [Oscillospiraceae bacterium]